MAAALAVCSTITSQTPLVHTCALSVLVKSRALVCQCPTPQPLLSHHLALSAGGCVVRAPDTLRRAAPLGARAAVADWAAGGGASCVVRYRAELGVAVADAAERSAGHERATDSAHGEHGQRHPAGT